MQVIKRVTFNAECTPMLNRPLAYGVTTKTQVCESLTNSWNQEVATFLQECGVDAYYGVREGYTEYEWLWVNGMPTFFSTSSTTLNVYYRGASVNSSTTIDTGCLPNGTYIFNFVGNPKKTFIFRIFTTDYTCNFLVRFNFVISLASAKRYPAIEGQTNIKSFSDQQNMMISISSSGRTLFKLPIDSPHYEKTEFFNVDVGEGILLMPVTARGASSLAPGIVVDGQYAAPNDIVGAVNIVESTELYQTEIDIGGRKFLVGYNPTGHGFGTGLIALDDDDPLISEEDLMSEVGL